MPLSPKTLEEKPYNMCLDCKYIGKRCDGPNFLAMSTERWCEWCRLRKEYLGWTNAYIADGAGVSKVSVDRVMSNNVKDLRISTMQSITRILVNGSWGQYPCAMAESETVYVDNPELVQKAAKAEAECLRLQTALDNINVEHKSDIVAAHADDQKKIDYLLKQINFKEEQMLKKDKLLDERADFLRMKDDTIKQEKRKNLILSLLLAVAVFVIIAALTVDKMNSDIGFFWLEKTLSAAFNGNGIASNVFNNIIEWRI